LLHDAGIGLLVEATVVSRTGTGIGGGDGEDAVLGAADGADLRAGVGGEAVSRGAGVTSGFGDHVRFERVEAVEFVDDAATAAPHTILAGLDNDARADEVGGLRVRGRNLVDIAAVDRDGL